MPNYSLKPKIQNINPIELAVAKSMLRTIGESLDGSKHPRNTYEAKFSAPTMASVRSQKLT